MHSERLVPHSLGTSESVTMWFPRAASPAGNSLLGKSVWVLRREKRSVHSDRKQAGFL